MFLIYLCIIVLFLYFSCLLILDPNRFEPSIDYSKKNHFCQELPKNAPLLDQLTCKNPYRKKKFLWFMIDGLAISQLNYLQSQLHSHANIFKVNSQDFYRQSGALHEMYLTGKFSNNFVGDPILIDNLFFQMNQAKHKLQFFGSPYPVAYLGGRPPNSLYFNESNIAIEEYPFEIICPILRETLYNGVHLQLSDELLAENQREKLYLFLDEKIGEFPTNISDCLREKKLFPADTELNLIYYTAMIDNHNHAFSKENSNTIKVTYGVEKFVLKMMKWIDENPEYALIFSSDHGGQDFFGEDSYCNHGCLKEGNQGILFTYVKEFGEMTIIQEKNEIDIFDIAPTISQLIEDVNIPIFVKGEPAILGSDDILAFVALRSKEIQLLEYVKVFNKEDVEFERKSYKKLQKFTNISQFKGLKDSELFRQYKQENDKLKEFVEEMNLKDNELYKFYPIASIIIFFIFYVWRDILLRKEFNIAENIVVFILIWINLYLDTCLAFNRNSPFEFSNKMTLYLSLISTIFVIKFMNKDFYLWSELKKFFRIFIRNTKKKDESKELPRFYQEYENLTKSVQINQIKTEKNSRIYLIIMIFSFFSLFMLYTELYVDLKKFQSFWEKSQILDLLNYPIFLYFLFKLIDKDNAHWFYTNQKTRLDIATLLKRFYVIILIFMAAYDIKRPRNFVNQNWSQQYLTRIIYGLLMVHLIWILCNKERNYDKDVGKRKRIGNFNEILTNFKIPVIVYLFFLNDEVDRIILCFYILPFYEYLTKIYHKINEPLMKLFIISVLLKVPDFFHVICKGTMTFDISLPAGNKTIGQYQDEFPIFTGVLFGTHKLQHYLMGAIFLLNVLGKETFTNKEETMVIFQVAFTKYILCNLPLWYYVFSKQQSFYLIIFMFCMGKVMLVGIFYLMNLILTISNYLGSRTIKKFEK